MKHHKKVISRPSLSDYFTTNAPQSVKTGNLVKNFTGKNCQLSFFDTSPPEVIRELGSPCKCGSRIGSESLESESSPHYSRLTCLECDRWVKWVKKADSQLGGES